jgi:uncharacterized protein
MSRVDRLIKRELITPPHFLKNSIQYEAIIGSVAYGVSADDSDVDLYGFCIPSKDIVFPHTVGVIQGFDKNFKRFDQFQSHHIEDKEARKTYDITIYNIVKYFRLCAEGNPNMIDSLFVPRRCVLHSTRIGELVRENRHLFLSKICWSKHKGYAYSQLSKMVSKNNLGVKLRAMEDKHGLDHTSTYENYNHWSPDEDFAEYKRLLKELSETTSTRHQRIREIGFDVKFAYHVVRLLNQVEQILTEHDLDLERNREQLKSIRKGEWSKELIQDYFDQKEKLLEKVYLESTLRYKPAIDEIKELLIKCLEEYYGSIDEALKRGSKETRFLVRDIENILAKYS